MIIPTEPIGSIPRPLHLIEAFCVTDSADPMLDPLYDEAIRDTNAHFEATGSPDPRVETPEEIRDRIMEVVRYIPLKQLGLRTTAGFLLSAMTLLRVARRLWPRSGHGSRR